MMVTNEQLRAAMDEHLAKITPPEGYYTSQWYVDNVYPELNRQKVSFILSSMVKTGDALKSDRQYQDAWYYKIVVKNND